MIKLVKKKKTNKGFTMIEIIIVIIVIAVLGAVSAEIIGNASKIYSTTLLKHKFLKKARYTFSKVSRETSWQKSYSNFLGSSNKRINIISNDSRLIDFRILNNNSMTYNNNQVVGSSNAVIANNLTYNNSDVYYLDHSGNIIDISTNSHLTKSLKLDFQFDDNNNSLRLTGYSLPYNLRIGRAMSYHE